MRIPRTINIHGHIWIVEPVSRVILGKGQDGMCYPVTRTIHYYQGLRNQARVATVLHEIRHAYQFESGFTQILDSQAMELDAEGFVGLVLSLLIIKFKN